MSVSRPGTDLLALLDAGALDPERAARVRAAAEGDERATAVLEALARTRAELAALPPPPVPEGVARRWAATVAQLSSEAEAAVPPVTPPSRGRDGRWRRRAVLAGAAAAVVLAVVVAAAGPIGSQRPSSSIVAVTTIDLQRLALGSLDVRDLGRLDDAGQLAGCLARIGERAGVAPDAEVVAGRRVVLDGREGVLLLLPTGVLGRFDIVVVDPRCGPDGGEVLTTGTIG